jgi:hypothetical protein
MMGVIIGFIVPQIRGSVVYHMRAYVLPQAGDLGNGAPRMQHSLWMNEGDSDDSDAGSDSDGWVWWDGPPPYSEYAAAA